MEINKSHDIRRLPTASFRGGSIKTKSTEDTKSGHVNEDTIKISTVGSFQAKLDGYSKLYSSKNDSFKEISASQILQLKSDYSDDHCPVSGSDIAASILSNTLGYEPNS